MTLCFSCGIHFVSCLLQNDSEYALAYFVATSRNTSHRETQELKPAIRYAEYLASCLSLRTEQLCLTRLSVKSDTPLKRLSVSLCQVIFLEKHLRYSQRRRQGAPTVVAA